MELAGLYTAMLTPFIDGVFDDDGFSENLEFQIKSGVDGLLVLGTTGEAPALLPQEKEQIIEMAMQKAKGHCQVIVGVGSNSTQATIDAAAKAKLAGCDAVLVVTPYYNRPTQKGIYNHFEALVAAVDIPVIIYNHPGRTGTAIDVLTMREIATLPNVVGLKDCSGDLHFISDVIHHTSDLREAFSVVVGNDSLCLPAKSVGANGVISILSNLCPRPMRELVHADPLVAKEIHYRLFPLFKAMELETNPIPIKEAMDACGLPSGPPRMPLHRMSEPHRAAMHALLANAGMLGART